MSTRTPKRVSDARRLSREERAECMDALTRKFSTPAFEPRTVLRYEATCVELEGLLKEALDIANACQCSCVCGLIPEGSDSVWDRIQEHLEGNDE